jgi:predicted molibdopterin-dependent oxidoreductase YjgC
MFRKIDGLAARPAVSLFFEDRSILAQEGDTIAIALMNAGARAFRETPLSGAARGPLCLMGVCFDCLVEVDGTPNVQACMVAVRDGMRVRLQHGARRFEGGT